MMGTKPASRLLVWVAIAMGSAAAACGSPSPAERPLAELPEYTSEEAAFFDDSLEPEIFGMGVDSPESPDLVRKLTHRADHVGRVRLATVTRESSEGRVQYRLQLKPVEASLVGPDMEPDVEVRVGSRSSSLTMLRSLDTEAVGKEFILFLKRYRSNDQSEWHFRALNDSAERREDIAAAR
jgi:hypothetical protein